MASAPSTASRLRPAASLAAGDARILVLDLDAHCGGGTHELLGDDPHVVGLDVAVDAFDRYRPAAPWSLDLVSHAADYLPTIERRLDALHAEAFDLVLYNAGMDPYEELPRRRPVGHRPRDLGRA